MSSRSYSYLAVHVGHQKMAIEANTQKYENFWVPLTNKGSIFLLIHELCNKNYISKYIRFTSTKSPSFVMTTISDLTSCSALLHQSRDYSCYVSRTPATPPLWLHKHNTRNSTALTAQTRCSTHKFVHPFDLWHEPGLDNVTYVRTLFCMWN